MILSMIRKVVIAVLALGVTVSCLAWGISCVGFSVGRCVYTKDDVDPIPQGSIVTYELTLHDGILHIEKGRLPANPISLELSSKLRGVLKPGWDYDWLGEEYSVGFLYSPSLWRPVLHRLGAAISIITIPLWILVMALGAYPVLVFVRGPLRRRRWKRRGLRIACGYDLRGNTSGVCSECGVDLAKAVKPLP